MCPFLWWVTWSGMNIVLFLDLKRGEEAIGRTKLLVWFLCLSVLLSKTFSICDISELYQTEKGFLMADITLHAPSTRK